MQDSDPGLVDDLSSSKSTLSSKSLPNLPYNKHKETVERSIKTLISFLSYQGQQRE